MNLLNAFILSGLIHFSYLGSCQVPLEKYDEIANNFKQEYNNSNYEKIFNLFSPEMKSALPLDQTIHFLSRLYSQARKIKHLNREGFQNISYAKFKTEFELTTLLLLVSLDANYKINGLYIQEYELENYPVLDRNLSKLMLPFEDEWYVVWGGDTKELNYHFDNRAQKYAFDFIVIDTLGKFYKTNGLKNEDYYAFGKKVLSPCNGTVVLKVDGIKDNLPGQQNTVFIPGNTLIIKGKDKEYYVLAHFKQNSIVVEEGQRVSQGEFLGYCGNSGNSSEPHIHFHLQNIESMVQAIGAKCFFKNITVDNIEKSGYSPIKGNRVKNTSNRVDGREH